MVVDGGVRRPEDGAGCGFTWGGRPRPRDVRAARNGDYVLAGPIDPPTAEIPAAQPRTDQVGALGVGGDQAFAGGGVDHEGVVQAGLDTVLDAAQYVLAERLGTDSRCFDFGADSLPLRRREGPAAVGQVGHRHGEAVAVQVAGGVSGRRASRTARAAHGRGPKQVPLLPVGQHDAGAHGGVEGAGAAQVEEQTRGGVPFQERP